MKATKTNITGTTQFVFPQLIGRHFLGLVSFDSPKTAKDELAKVCHFYRENLKGGHTHDHVYNVCFRCSYRGKNRRRALAKRDEFDKLMCRSGFEEALRTGALCIELFTRKTK